MGSSPSGSRRPSVSLPEFTHQIDPSGLGISAAGAATLSAWKVRRLATGSPALESRLPIASAPRRLNQSRPSGAAFSATGRSRSGWT